MIQKTHIKRLNKIYLYGKWKKCLEKIGINLIKITVVVNTFMHNLKKL
jgi:hypothetical protein